MAPTSKHFVTFLKYIYTLVHIGSSGHTLRVDGFFFYYDKTLNPQRWNKMKKNHMNRTK